MRDIECKMERTWIEINVENLRHNVKILKEAMPPECELMAVVKAEAYGHGGALISGYLNEMGVTAFAVATIDEAINLRKCGIRGEILVLGHTGVCRVPELKEFDLTQSLIGLEYAEVLNDQGIRIKTHIKIDTGMHRLGVPSGEISAVKNIFLMKNLKVCGIFTHLCCSDSRKPEDMAFTRKQIDSFYRLANALENDGVHLPKLHMQSSYGLLNYPDLRCDYVRAGIALYGVPGFPGDNTVLQLDLRPVLSLKSRVALVRPVKKGDCIGYGRSFTAAHDMRIAILPVGYGDGFPRSLSNGNGSIWVNHRMAPVVGHICMDQLAVDITNAGNVSAGDIATLIGEESGGELSAPAVADRIDSISNELLCRLGTRLPVLVVS